MKILIVQSLIPLYRVPFFNGLSRAFGKNLTLIQTQGSTEARRDYHEFKLKDFTIKNMHFTFGLFNHFRHADVVIVMFDLRWVSLMLLTLVFRKKVLLWGHGYGAHPLSRFIRRIFIHLTPAILVYEERASQELQDDGIDNEKVFYTGNTVLVENHGINEHTERTRFLYVGRLQARKELNEIIDAFKMLENQLPEKIGLSFVGDGDIRQQLEQKVKSLGLENRVQFYGAVYDPDELKAHYDTAIAYVSPGHVGLGVLHSFAYGVPVVTREDRKHAPEVENIKDGVTGLFYSEGALRLSSLMLSLLNENRARKLGSAAYNHYVNSRSMDMMVQRAVKAIDYVYECCYRHK